MPVHGVWDVYLVDVRYSKKSTNAVGNFREVLRSLVMVMLSGTPSITKLGYLYVYILYIIIYILIYMLWWTVGCKIDQKISEGFEVHNLI